MFSNGRGCTDVKRTFKPCVYKTYDAACRSYYKKKEKKRMGGIENWLKEHGRAVFKQNYVETTCVMIPLRSRYSRNGSAVKFWVPIEDPETGERIQNWYQRLCKDIGCESIETVDGREISYMGRADLAKHPEFFCEFPELGESEEMKQVIPLAKYSENTNSILAGFHRKLIKCLIEEVSKFLGNHKKRRDIKKMFSVEQSNEWLDHCIQKVVISLPENGEMELVGRMMKENNMADVVEKETVKGHLSSRLREVHKKPLMLVVQDLEESYIDAVQSKKNEKIATEFLGKKIGSNIDVNSRSAEEDEEAGGDGGIYPSLENEKKMLNEEERETKERESFISSNLWSALNEAGLMSDEEYSKTYDLLLKKNPWEEVKAQWIASKQQRNAASTKNSSKPVDKHLGEYNSSGLSEDSSASDNQIIGSGTSENQKPKTKNEEAASAVSSHIGYSYDKAMGKVVSPGTISKLQKLQLQEARKETAKRIFQKRITQPGMRNTLSKFDEELEKQNTREKYAIILPMDNKLSKKHIIKMTTENERAFQELNRASQTGGNNGGDFDSMENERKIELKSMNPNVKHLIGIETRKLSTVEKIKADTSLTKSGMYIHEYQPEGFKNVTFLVEDSEPVPTINSL